MPQRTTTPYSKRNTSGMWTVVSRSGVTIGSASVDTMLDSPAEMLIGCDGSPVSNVVSPAAVLRSIRSSLLLSVVSSTSSAESENRLCGCDCTRSIPLASSSSSSTITSSLSLPFLLSSCSPSSSPLLALLPLGGNTSSFRYVYGE